MIEVARDLLAGNGLCDRPKRSTSARLVIAATLQCALAAGIFFATSSVSAQTRDHLTDQETDLVRDNQELDKRIDVFIKAADRRFAIINGTPQPTPKKTKKDEPDWGEPPKGTRTELLSDIAGILDEAITNIDDVSRRDEKNPLISRSMRKLTAASKGYLTQLAALRDKTKDADELSAIERAAVNAGEIVEVGSKLPSPNVLTKQQEDAILGAKPEQSANGEVQIVMNWFQENLHDPYSIRIVRWSRVEKQTFPDEPYWVIKVRLRAKNSFGAYVVNDYSFFIRHNKIVRFVN